MIMKLFPDPARDYAATLRRRLVLYVGMGILGMLMLCLHPHAVSSFPKDDPFQYQAARIYHAICTAMMGISILSSIGAIRLLRSPEARRQKEIKEADERRQHISLRAQSATHTICGFGALAAAIIVGPLNFAVFLTLMAVFAAHGVIAGIAAMVYGKLL